MHSVRPRVTFSSRVTVYFQSKWPDSDYILARRGPWIRYAADRARFKRRINIFERQFEYIFTDKHRKRMINAFNVDSSSAIAKMCIC